ncbi:hypothetical protein JQC73_15455, partial [Enterococcus durans]
MSIKETTQITRQLNAIYKAAHLLQEHFVDKKVSFVGEVSTVAIIFSTTNFMHLCGIDYRRGTHLFFQDALDRKINLQDIQIKTDGTTFQKLQVIGSLDLLLGK